MTFFIGNNKVARVSASTAGGSITGPGAATAFFDGNNISLNGDGVAPHGDSPHDAATVVASNNTTFFISNKLVVVDSDNATCGDAVNG